MALTPEGAALTDAHRIAQVRLGGEAMLEAAAVWPMLDLADLDGSMPAWMVAMTQVVEAQQGRSADLAAAYVERFRDAEVGEQPGPIVRPIPDLPATVAGLRISGPVQVKRLIGNGVEAERAFRAGMGMVQGMVMQLALQAGRGVIDGTARQDRRSGRYRRVSDGQPCAFCAMLVGRGPVYSEETAYFRAHPRCGCSAEIVYGEWVPNELEQKWRDSYFQAARQADAAEGRRVAPVIKEERYEDTILWRMRRNTPDLFTDGVKPKKKD